MPDIKTQQKKSNPHQISFENVVAIMLTDTHFNKENLEQVIDIFRQCKELAKKCKVNKIIHGGDIFTNRTGQSLQTLLAFQRVLSEYSEEGIELLGIPGNHCKTDLDSEESYLDVFSEHRNFKLFSKYGYEKIENIYFHFLPYFHNTYDERLSKIEAKGKIDILITHQAINGVKNNDGTEVTNCLSPKKFEMFDKVLVGHYHNASQIGDNIYYIGSSHQSNFGETIPDKGFTLIYEDGSIAKVQSKFRKFIKIKLDAKDNASVQEALEFTKQEDANYRFIFGGERTDLDNLNLTKFTEVGIECKFESFEVNSEILKAENEELLQFDKATIQKQFIKFSKLQEIEISKRNVGLRFIREHL